MHERLWKTFSFPPVEKLHFSRDETRVPSRIALKESLKGVITKLALSPGVKTPFGFSSLARHRRKTLAASGLCQAAKDKRTDARWKKISVKSHIKCRIQETSHAASLFFIRAHPVECVCVYFLFCEPSACGLTCIWTRLTKLVVCVDIK